MGQKKRYEWVKDYVDRYVNLINSGRFESIDLLAREKEAHLPKYLYKYYSANEFCISSIVNNSVYLTKPADFNDPFDSFILKDEKLFVKKMMINSVIKDRTTEFGSANHFSEIEYYSLYNAPITSRNSSYSGYKEGFESLLSRILRSKANQFQHEVYLSKAEFYHEVAQIMKNVREKTFYISCFSHFESETEFENQTVMWSHYAKNHTGICVKYSVKSFELEEPIRESILCGMYPVSYTSRVPMLGYRDFSSAIKNMDGDYEWSNHTHRKLFKMVLTKSRFWSYENEWRLVLDANIGDLIMNQSLPFFKVDSIYLGCRMKSDIKLLFKKLTNQLNVKLFESTLADNRLALTYNMINNETKIYNESIQHYKYNLNKEEKSNNNVISQFLKEYDLVRREMQK